MDFQGRAGSLTSIWGYYRVVWFSVVSRERACGGGNVRVDDFLYSLRRDFPNTIRGASLRRGVLANVTYSAGLQGDRGLRVFFLRLVSRSSGLVSVNVTIYGYSVEYYNYYFSVAIFRFLPLLPYTPTSPSIDALTSLVCVCTKFLSILPLWVRGSCCEGNDSSR